MSNIKKRHVNHVEKAVAHNAENQDRKSLHIIYKKKNGRTVKRKIDPLTHKNGLVVAWDHKRKAIRSFRLERVKDMKKAAFWMGFGKKASAVNHAVELAGLGTLAVPSIQKLRGKKIDNATSSKYELAGLGMLAAPSVAAVARKALVR